ncbi:MAG: hypothetical protein ACRDJE_05040 [Dehalococcoidia bacterium]
MDLPLLSETNCPPGTRLRPHEVTYTEEEIESYGERTGERAEEYRVDGVLRVPPGLLLVQPMRLIHNNFHYETGVHVSSDLVVHDLPSAGETVTVGGSVVDLFERNGSKYITFHTEVTGADGRAHATIDHTSIYALARR